MMTECPEEYSGYHFWENDGPYHVRCDLCGAEGRIEVIEYE